MEQHLSSLAAVATVEAAALYGLLVVAPNHVKLRQAALFQREGARTRMMLAGAMVRERR